MIWNFLREVEENYSIVGYYPVSSSNSLPAFRYDQSVSSLKGQESKNGFLTFEDGTNRLSRNVGKELLLLTA